MIASAASLPASSLDQVHADFFAALTRITAHARCSFRHVRCQDKQPDRTNEVIALCWNRCARLVLRGKNPIGFASILAPFATRHVHSGRKLCGQDSAKDVINERAQDRHSFTVATPT